MLTGLKKCALRAGAFGIRPCAFTRSPDGATDRRSLLAEWRAVHLAISLRDERLMTPPTLLRWSRFALPGACARAVALSGSLGREDRPAARAGLFSRLRPLSPLPLPEAGR